MCKKKGRTARCRKRKTYKINSIYQSSDDENYKSLLLWMKKQFQFSSKLLKIASFPETGRGISAKKAIKLVPRCALLGPKQAFEESILLKTFLLHGKQNEISSFSKIQVLSTFLIEEKRKLKDCSKSKWAPYVNVLPKSFTHPLYWSDSILRLLPQSLYCVVENARRQVKTQLDNINNLIASLQCFIETSTSDKKLAFLLCRNFTYAEYKWAWCCVNTRCVYSNHEESAIFNLCDSSIISFYLVPFLDLLNHSPDAEVNAKFNFKTNCFEIITLNSIKRFEQVFIHYGDHSNAKLLTEYGFVSTKEVNKNDIVPVTWAEIAELHELSAHEEEVLSNYFIKRSFQADCCFTYDGPSWSLTAALLAIHIYRLQNGFCQTNTDIFKKSVQLKEPKVKHSLRLLASAKTSHVRARIEECGAVLKDLSSSSEKIHLALVANYWRICFDVLASSGRFIPTVDLTEYDEHLFT